jgi:transcriptional regulator with XRE-family HTH domain
MNRSILTASCRVRVVAASLEPEVSFPHRSCGDVEMNVVPDSKKIRDLREKRGLSQEQLASKGKVSARTVQRAEAGEKIEQETLADIAAVLGATYEELLLTDGARHQDEAVESGAVVVLHRTSSAREIVHALQRADLHVLDYDVDPAEDNVDLLAGLIERLESFAPPWATGAPPQEENRTVAQTIRDIATINKDVSSLEALGIYVFLGEYLAKGLRLRWDNDEGFWYTKGNQKEEPLRAAVVHLSKSALNKLTRGVSDRWTEPPPERKPIPPVELDDEVPF